MTNNNSLVLKIKTDACAGTEYAVNYLEHVQAVITVNATRRGDLELFLTSPMGTRYARERERLSRLLAPLITRGVANWVVYMFCVCVIYLFIYVFVFRFTTVGRWSWARGSTTTTAETVSPSGHSWRRTRGASTRRVYGNWRYIYWWLSRKNFFFLGGFWSLKIKSSWNSKVFEVPFTYIRFCEIYTYLQVQNFTF